MFRCTVPPAISSSWTNTQTLIQTLSQCAGIQQSMTHTHMYIPHSMLAYILCWERAGTSALTCTLVGHHLAKAPALSQHLTEVSNHTNRISKNACKIFQLLLIFAVWKNLDYLKLCKKKIPKKGNINIGPHRFWKYSLEWLGKVSVGPSKIIPKSASNLRGINLQLWAYSFDLNIQ